MESQINERGQALIELITLTALMLTMITATMTVYLETQKLLSLYEFEVTPQ